MDKEIQMFAKNALLLAVVALGLTACQGENTLSRQSNPVKAYEPVLQNTRPWNEQRQAQEIAERKKAESKPCGTPFNVSIEGERGLSSTFREEQAKTITIHVTSTLDDQDWDVVGTFACVDCFKPISKTQQEGIYQFTWTPARGSSNSEDNFLLLSYKYSIEARCAATVKNTATIALVVKKNEDQTPQVSFPGVPTDPIKFGDSFNFQVQVIDPAATAGSEVKVRAVDLKKGDKALSAREAVNWDDCLKNGKKITDDDKQIVTLFDCTFNSRLINDKYVRANSGTGDTVAFAFAVKATSLVTQQSSAASAAIPVLFEKITPQSSENKPAKTKKAKGT
jgi:hypothetical protein